MSDKPKASEARATPAIDEWNRVVREAYAGDEADARDDGALAMSDEEIERHLLAAGVDLAAEDAKAAATYDAIVAKREGKPPAPTDDEPAWVATTATPAPTKSRNVWLVYAIAAALAIAGAAYVAGRPTPPPPETPPDEKPVVHPPEPAPPPPSPVAPPAPQSPPPSDKGGKAPH